MNIGKKNQELSIRFAVALTDIKSHHPKTQEFSLLISELLQKLLKDML